MEDTDWRPSPCPGCGKMRDAARHPECNNPACDAFPGNKRTMTAKTESKPRYLWVRPNSVESPLVFIDDPIDLFRGAKFDESVDKLYQLGNEVKFKVTLEPVPNYRLSEDKAKTVRTISGYRETFENRE